MLIDYNYIFYIINLIQLVQSNYGIRCMCSEQPSNSQLLATALANTFAISTILFM